ncbi:MAG: hypothetical protein J6U53_04010 [Tidjanibacter sp.]|nr:hypothetical protein [Tidjanibacter sp.]
MKKLFYAFLIAATALLGGCNDLGNEGFPLPEGSDNTALTFDACEVYYRGDYYNKNEKNFVVFCETISNDEATRRVAFELNTTNVNESNIPVGTFSVADGNMTAGSTDGGILGGSYYIRNTLSTAYILMLIENATLTITEKEDGTYALDAKIAGNDNIGVELEEGEEYDKVVDIECHYEGTPVMSGLKANNQFNASLAPFLCAVEYDEFVEDKKTYAEWNFTYYSYNYLYFSIYNQFYSTDFETNPVTATHFTIITDAVEEGEEKIFPLGTFNVDGFSTGYKNTVLGATVLFLDPNVGDFVEDVIYDGSVKISALGEGQYSISSTLYGFYDAYKLECSQTQFIDNTEVEVVLDPTNSEQGSNGIYLDWQENVNGDHWVMTLMDSTNGLLMEMFLYSKTEGTTIPSGTYKVADSSNTENLGEEYQGVLLQGSLDSEGYYSGGSLIYNMDGDIVGLIQDGELTINNDGNGRISVAFELNSHDNTLFYGSGICSSVGVSYPSRYTISEAFGVYLGFGGWMMHFADMTKLGGQGLDLRTLVITDEDATFADGLPCEKFRFDSSANPGTVLAGAYTESGYQYSLLVSIDGKSLFAVLTDGYVEIINNGDGTHTIDVNCSDDEGNKHYGTFTGEVVTVDGTVEASEVASLKKAAANNSSVIEWSNFGKRQMVEQTKPSKEDVAKIIGRKLGL